MTRPLDERDPLVTETRRRGERHRRYLEEGEEGVARRLAQVGVLGWMIVTPTILGLFGGRWLDRRAGTGLLWTGALLTFGLAVGCWSAWRWMHES
jgi:ATP synthase protein I